MQRQHELEIANARLGERLNLAHDLHDGLGGTLVSSIVTLERARVGRLGGIFDIKSSPGSTLVAVQFPSLAMKKNEKDPPMDDLLPDQA